MRNSDLKVTLLASRRLIAALLALSLLVSCARLGPPERAIHIGTAFDESVSASPKDIKRALEKGTDYLIKTQNPDGSWGSFDFPYEIIYLGTIASFDAFRNASSALCCMALMKDCAGKETERRAALNKGIRFLMKQVPECRSTPDVLYHTWALLYVTQCLSRAIKYDGLDIPKKELIDSANKWLRMLQHMQYADGGFGYYDFGYGYQRPPGFESTSFMTGAALCTFWDAQKAGLTVSPGAISSAIKCLKRMRTPEKSYSYGTDIRLYPAWHVNRPKGSLGRSQPCNLALFRYQDEVTMADLKLGLDWMFKEHHFMEIGKYRPYPHEAWYATSGYYFFFGHFYASEVIGELPVEEQKPYWQALARTILPCQEKDGSWWDYPLYNYYKAYGTAYALLILSPAFDMLDKVDTTKE